MNWKKWTDLNPTGGGDRQKSPHKNCLKEKLMSLESVGCAFEPRRMRLCI
jgi:hypothetical protein